MKATAIESAVLPMRFRHQARTIRTAIAASHDRR